MSAEVETFVYNGEPAWHGLGTENWNGKYETSQVNWEVNKIPGFISLPNGEVVYMGRDALVRSSDNKILDTVSGEWNDVPNKTAFEFFEEYCDEGGMKLETCGSLRGGQIVFALAKIQESFELFKGKDKIDSWLLFTNPHRYGWATSVSWSAIRVVCMNTLVASLTGTAKDKIIKVSHRNEFVAEEVKEVLGISKDKLAKYKEMAVFLGSKKAKGEDVVTFFKRIFPVLTKKEESTKEMSKNAKTCVDILETQPGAEFGKGTWWPVYNSISYFTDHIASRSQDARLASAWYGNNRKLKVKALETAMEMADK